MFCDNIILYGRKLFAPTTKNNFQPYTHHHHHCRGRPMSLPPIKCYRCRPQCRGDRPVAPTSIFRHRMFRKHPMSFGMNPVWETKSVLRCFAIKLSCRGENYSPLQQKTIPNQTHIIITIVEPDL